MLVAWYLGWLPLLSSYIAYSPSYCNLLHNDSMFLEIKNLCSLSLRNMLWCMCVCVFVCVCMVTYMFQGGCCSCIENFVCIILIDFISQNFNDVKGWQENGVDPFESSNSADKNKRRHYVAYPFYVTNILRCSGMHTCILYIHKNRYYTAYQFNIQQFEQIKLNAQLWQVPINKVIYMVYMFDY